MPPQPSQLEQEFLTMCRNQARAIIEREDNRWIDTPEKLLIAVLYRLTKDGHIK